jgi:ADP-dependent NAD(P)H-hydrate dehydratase / NAD(P)H-hydrate epimerase
MRIVYQAEMKEIEAIASSKFHFQENLIVEQVGVLAAHKMDKYLQSFDKSVEIIFLIGKGNNGADGLALARQLSRKVDSIHAFMLFDAKECTQECLAQLKRAEAYGVRVTKVTELDDLVGYFEQNVQPKVIVDAIFGTGVRLPLSQFIYDVINFINQHAAFTIAMDIPSGVDGDSGLIQGNAIKADCTFSVGFPKMGYYVADGAKLTGEIEHIDIGFPSIPGITQGDKFLLTEKALSYSPESRNKFADKKIFGHSMVIGGSHGLTGALVMASCAAIKVGTGLVTAATWENQYQEFISRLIPEVMTGYIPNDQAKWNRVIKDLNKYSSIVIGPGLARSLRARKVVLEILNNFSGPVVLDADAINVLNLKEDHQVFAMRNAPTVMTPHLGEFARFTGLNYDDVCARPVHHLKNIVEQINASIVLKGPSTYLGFTSGEVYVNFSPNDGMATGGVGDVLAGILGGLMAQHPVNPQSGLENRYKMVHQSVLLGVFVHSLAGRSAAIKYGVRPMTAMSLIESLPDAFKELDQVLKV